MPVEKSLSKQDILTTPTEPVRVDSEKSVAALLEKMKGISFQGRSLALAFDIWKQMLQDECTIMMGLAGALVPAGMRRLVVWLIENRALDCLVSTGANFFHDIHESLGHKHYQGSPAMDDVMLQEHMIDRIYDTLADENEFRRLDEWLGVWSGSLEQRPYTSREFLYALGKEIAQRAVEEGIVTAAYKANIPLYCPAIADSSIGIGLAQGRYFKRAQLVMDVVQDVVETARIAATSRRTGVIYFGGGTPKNFIQQAEVTAMMIRANVQGHYYAIQCTTDAPHWGGLSGCTFEEAQSWGKIAKRARMVSCYCDATIALPLLVTGLSECTELLKRRRRPEFKLGRELELIA